MPGGPDSCRLVHVEAGVPGIDHPRLAGVDADADVDRAGPQGLLNALGGP